MVVLDSTDSLGYLLKIAAESEKRDRYPTRMLAAAPFAAASAVADVPKGWVDKSVEQAVRGAGISSSSYSAPWRTAVGRGSGRLGAGILTSPIFLDGISDLKSDDPKKKKRGYLKVLASGAVFSTLKGGIEGSVVGAGKGTAEIVKQVKNLAGSRGILGMGAAVLTAKAVANSSKVHEGPKQSVRDRFVLPALAGAGIGGTKGIIEEALTEGKKITARGALASASGRAAAGALGVLAISELIKKVGPRSVKDKPGYRLSPSKSDPTKRRWQKVASVDTQQGSMYSDVHAWADENTTKDVRVFLADLSGPGSEGTASRRASQYALQDSLASRNVPTAVLPMREHVAPSRRSVKVTPELALALFASPAVGAIAEVAMESIPMTDRDRVLSDALDRLHIKNKIHRVTSSTYAASTDGNAIFLPAKGSDMPGVVAHELGHAQSSGLRRATIGSARSVQARQVGAFIGIGVSVAVAASASDPNYNTTEELESKSKFLRAIGIAAAAAQAPSIMEEVAANVKAVSILRSVGDSTALRRVTRQAGPGLATYLAPAAIPFAVSAILRYKARKHNRREDGSK